jgi:hypothetical protein
MASIASDMGFYDSSISFLKTAYDLGEENPEQFSEIKKELDVWKKTVVATHNQMVLKRKERVGLDYKGILYA